MGTQVEKVLLITFDFNEQKSAVDYERFLKVIEKYDNQKINNSSYAIYTVDSTLEISQFLKPYIGENDKVLIIKLSNPYWGGWLLPDQKAWFDHRL